MYSDERPRTLLAKLVAGSDRTHEEHVAAFNELARKMEEPATLSLRQFERWLAGELSTLPRPTARRVAEAHWGRPVQALLGPPSDTTLEIVPRQTDVSSTGAVVSGEEEDMERRALLRRVLTNGGLGLAAPMLAVVERVRRAMDDVLDTSNVSPATIERWERTAYEYACSAPLRMRT